MIARFLITFIVIVWLCLILLFEQGLFTAKQDKNYLEKRSRKQRAARRVHEMWEGATHELRRIS